MRKHFNDWYRVRANLPKLVDPMSEIFDPLSLGVLGLGAAAGYGIKKGVDWWRGRKPEAQLANKQAARDPRSAQNMPVSRDDLESDPKWHMVLTRFADNIGLSGTLEPELLQSLSNIAAARIYGQAMGAVEEADLAHVWYAINKPDTSIRRSKTSPTIPTIAQRFGVTRPLAIPMKVPGAVATVRYGITKAAQQFDQQAVVAMRSSATPQQQPQGTKPTPGDPDDVGSSVGGGGSGSSVSKGMKRQHIMHLMNMPDVSGVTVWSIVQDSINRNGGTAPANPPGRLILLSKMLKNTIADTDPAITKSMRKLLKHVFSQIQSL